MKLKTALKTTLATAGVLAGAGSASADSYTIQSGDTLSELSLKFGVSLDDLVNANNIADANMIFAGSQLEVPNAVHAANNVTEKTTETVANNGTYTVKAGDTLSKIAAANGVSVSQIASVNGIANVNYITVGQVLNLHEATPVQTPEVQAENTADQNAVVTAPVQQENVVTPAVETTQATNDDVVAPVVVTPAAPAPEVTETTNTVVENTTPAAPVEQPTVTPTVNETPVATEVVTTPAQPAETVNTTVTHTPAASTPNTYYYGQCTWFVKNNAPWVGNAWGNAADWAHSARAAGFTVDNAPAVGSVVVFQPGQGGAGGYGHVAYVVGVNGNQITIQEANYNGLLFHQRTINGSGLEYIHNY